VRKFLSANGLKQIKSEFI